MANHLLGLSREFFRAGQYLVAATLDVATLPVTFAKNTYKQELEYGFSPKAAYNNTVKRQAEAIVAGSLMAAPIAFMGALVASPYVSNNQTILLSMTAASVSVGAYLGSAYKNYYNNFIAKYPAYSGVYGRGVTEKPAFPRVEAIKAQANSERQKIALEM